MRASSSGRVITVILVLLAMCTSASIAATIHVPGDQPTIQAGIDAAVAGDTVLVAPGSYAENLVMKSGVVLASEMGAGATWLNAAASASAIRCVDVMDAAIEGFTISGGGGSWVGNDLAGGGILCVSSSPLIRRNHIVDCHIYYDIDAHLQAGGGIACLSGSAPLIEENDVSHNTLENGFSEFAPFTAGGGIYCDATSAAVVRGCTLQGNAARNGGAGGLQSDSPAVLVEDCTIEFNTGSAAAGFGSQGTVRRCVIRGNVGNWPRGAGGCEAMGECQIVDCLIIGNVGGTWIEGGPGGIEVVGGRVVISGNTIVGNLAPSVAGIWLWYRGEDVTIERNIVAMNGRDGQGAGIAAETGTFLRCNDVWGNAAGDDCAFEGINDNICVDPLFCDPAGGNFYLDSRSPCAPEHQPECGLIGALGVACGTTATQAVTWGTVKDLFRR